MHWVKRLLFVYLFAIAALVGAALIAMVTSPPVTRDADTYYEAYWNPPETFDPTKCYETRGSDFIGMVVEGLYEFDGFTTDLIPALAAEMPEVTEGGTVYTIRLRPNVRYPDVEPWKGTPRHVKAADLEFAFKRMADYHRASRHFDHFMRGRVVGADEFFAYTTSVDAEEVDYDRSIEGIEVLDDLTLRITLNEPFPQFIFKLTLQCIAPMPREWYMVQTNNNTEPENIRWMMFGTGPYMLEDYQREVHCRFVANPLYRGRPNVDGHPSGQGGPHPSLEPHEILPYSAQRVKFTYNREQLPRWFNFTLGLYDKSRVPRDAFGSAIGINGSVSDELANRGVIMQLQQRPTVRYIGFAMDIDWIRENIALRRAMSLALDRDRHVAVFQNGDGEVSRGLIPTMLSRRDASHMPPYEDFQLEEARRLVEEAKQFHRDTYGEELPTIKYTTGSVSSLARQDAENCKLSWERIGLDIELEFVLWGKFLEDYRNRRFMCWRLGWVADYPDEETFLSLFYSKNRSPGPNGTCYNNPEYDALYVRAVKMQDGPERQALYHEMLDMIERDVPVINIWYDVIRDLGYDWLGIRDENGIYVPQLRDHVWLKARWAYFHMDSELREARLGGKLTGTYEQLVESGQWIPKGDPRRPWEYNHPALQNVSEM